MLLDVLQKLESWEDETDAVGGGRLALTFKAMADIDLLRSCGGSRKPDEAALAASIHVALTGQRHLGFVSDHSCL